MARDVHREKQRTFLLYIVEKLTGAVAVVQANAFELKVIINALMTPTLTIYNIIINKTVHFTCCGRLRG